MDIIEAIRLRKSIRGYKPDPVPKHILKEIDRIVVKQQRASSDDILVEQVALVEEKRLTALLEKLKL